MRHLILINFLFLSAIAFGGTTQSPNMVNNRTITFVYEDEELVSVEQLVAGDATRITINSYEQSMKTYCIINKKGKIIKAGTVRLSKGINDFDINTSTLEEGEYEIKLIERKQKSKKKK